MKTLYLLGIIYVALNLQACASLEGTKPADPNPPALKDPIKVSIIAPEKKLGMPYQVLGKASISKYNAAGNMRQEATIKDLMREFAANMNGDAVINIHRDHSNVTATVVAYKRVMV